MNLNRVCHFSQTSTKRSLQNKENWKEKTWKKQELSSFLVSILCQLSFNTIVHLRSFLCICQLFPSNLFALIISSTLYFPPLLQPINHRKQVNQLHDILDQNSSIGWLSISIRMIDTHLPITSWYFHPNSWPSLPTVQYFRPGCSRSTRSACGTTTRFLRSYGGGMPSKVLRRCIAAAPRAVLCGIMPRTVRQKILEGARKWKGPFHSLVSFF